MTAFCKKLRKWFPMNFYNLFSQIFKKKFLFSKSKEADHLHSIILTLIVRRECIVNCVLDKKTHIFYYKTVLFSN